MLQSMHPHPRDALLTFEEATHVYTFVPTGERVRASVTQLLKPHFETFDGPAVVSRLFDGWLRDEGHKYHALVQYLTAVRRLDRATSEGEVLALWKAKGDRAAEAGTAMHAEIEAVWNRLAWDGGAVERESPSLEVCAMLRAFESFGLKEQLRPFRTEFPVVLTAIDDAGVEFPVLAGSIDFVAKDQSGRAWVFDWKRVDPSKKGLLGKTAMGGPRATPPFQAHPANQYAAYSAQLWTYARILEMRYGMTVAGCVLVQLHPALQGRAHVVEALDMRAEVETLLDLLLLTTSLERAGQAAMGVENATSASSPARAA